MAKKASSKRKSDIAGSRDPVVMLPLGGCGEIGMNLYLYGIGPERDRKWLMVDLGVKFGDERDPGIDVILPDTAFIEEQGSALQGIVITHAHEDHFGAVAYLWPRLRVPVYASPFAAALLRRKLGEAGIEDEVELIEVDLDQRFKAGAFDCEFLSVTHSIPEPNALIIRTPAGMLIHTGDWKLDPSPVIGDAIDQDRLRALRKEGCRALVCDSTNVLREGSSPSESEIAEGLLEVIRGASKRVAVTTFASNVGRVKSIAKAAEACNRHVVIVGRALRTNIGAATDAGYMDGMPEFHDDENFGYIPRERVLCICTGSQGELRAALARIAHDNHPQVALEEDDMVIFSSRTIPGNEKSVAAVHNALAANGVKIVTADDALVHVTGHPRRGELRQMYDWLKPELVVPMHGEARHLWEHARFAKECGVSDAIVVRNGDIAKLMPGAPSIVDEAPWGRLHVDGDVIVSAVDGPARIRRKMSFNGMVAVSLMVDDAGDPRGEPEIEILGLPENGRDGRSMDDIVYDVVDDVFDVLPKAKRRNDEVLEEFVYQAVRRAVDRQWGKRPACIVFVHRV